MEPTTVDALIERYEALLIDAYGVLVDASGALPGAAALIERLERDGKPYAIVTNDASKLETTSARIYGARGVPIRAERVVTSGSLLTDYFAQHDLDGARTLVIGPEDTCRYVERAGGEPVPCDAAEGWFDVVVAGDEAGYDFLPGVERAMSIVFAQLEAGGDFRMVLPNPDLIYPQAEGAFGFAAGSIALLIENAIRTRFWGLDFSFDRLGKPHAAIFDAAVRRVGTERCVMVGDQIATDIRGARAFGIDAALAQWGLTKSIPDDLEPEARPTWLLANLREAC